MLRNRLEGIGHQLKGAVKAGLGRILGDAKLAADGTREQTTGEAQVAADADLDRTLGIDPDRIKGVVHQVKGSLKAGLGSVFGNMAMERDGVAERAAGKIQNEAGSARDAAIDTPGTIDVPPSNPPV